MAIQLNGGVSLAPSVSRYVGGRAYTQAVSEPEPIISDPPRVRLQSPIPLPIISQFPYIEFDGMTPTGFGVVPIQDLLTLEPEPDEIIIYPSPFIPIEPEVGADVPEEWEESMEDILGDTPGTPMPITDPISFDLPDVGGWLEGIGGILKGALPWLIIIGGAFLLLRKR